MATSPKQITPLPTPAPSRNDPLSFPSRADATMAALPTLVEEVNEVAVEVSEKHAEMLGASAYIAQAEIGAVVAEVEGLRDGVQTNADTVAAQLSTVASQAAEVAANTATAEAARDAAYVNANVYASTAAGLAAVADGVQFQVVAADGLSISRYRRDSSSVATAVGVPFPSASNVLQKSVFQGSVFDFNDSKNLYNPGAKQSGKYVSSSGDIKSDAAWGCTGYIPVVAGETYSISSNTAKRVGLAFFSNNSTNLYLSGSYSAATSNPLSVVAPSGANYMVVNIYSNTIAEPTELQIEHGAATAYAEYFAGRPKVSSAAAVEVGETIFEASDMFLKVAGTNLYNPAEKQSGKYVGTGGVIVSNVAWGCTGYLPVVPGESYSIRSNTTKRVGLAFFATDVTLDYLAGSYTSASDNPLTVIAPAGANFMVVNLWSNTITEPTEVQVEHGAPTAYTPWIPAYPQVNKESIYPPIEETALVYPHEFSAIASLSSSSDLGSSYIQCTGPNAGVIRQNISPFIAPTLHQSNVFNFHSELLDGVLQRTNGDDVAPYRVFGTTIGANHGYLKTTCTVPTHGKTLADVGSVWSDSINDWVLVDVPSTQSLTITRRNANVNFTGVGTTLTHVSGATNTASFTPSAVAQSQWYPAIKNRTLKISIDGVAVTEFDQVYSYSKNVTFAESYEIMNKNSIVEWLITQVGTSPTVASYNGTADLSVSMAYIFDTEGGVTINTDFLALNSVAAFQDIMFTQAGPLNAGVAGAVRYYVPKSLAFTHESTAYDFRTLRDMTGLSITSRIDFTPDRCEATGLLVDRLIQLNNNFAMAVGYLPIQSASPDNRRTLAAKKALQISQAAKIYPSAVDSLAITSLAAGDYYSVTAYRKFYKRVSGITASYVVRAGDADYLYCDWHNAYDAYRVAIPSDLHGRSFEVVEKSGNVSMLSGAATSSVVFKVESTAVYGFAVLRFQK